MEIIIISVQKANEGFFVDFQTKFGNGRGLWSSNECPKTNSKYDIELEIEDKLRWGIEIKVNEKRKYEIDFQNQSLILQGQIESLEDDGFVALRFDKSVILLVAQGTPLADAKDFITVNAKNIKLFETGI